MPDTDVWRKPIYIGPTWERDDAGAFVAPEYTLGWDIAGWCTKYLRDLDDPEKPWRFTAEQLRFVLWWYALDEHGDFAYRSSVLQRLKGWGKDPLGAVLCLVELVGPSRFAGWSSGRAVALPGDRPLSKRRSRSWVEVYATAQEQTYNTMQLIPLLCSEELKSRYQLDPKKEIIYALGGNCVLKARASGHRVAEGGRATFMLLNEIQHWTPGNGGRELFKTVQNNVTKMNSRYLAITNAYRPGEESVAERLREEYDKAAQGLTVERSYLLYDSVEAHPDTPLTRAALELVLPQIRGDAVWLEIDPIIISMLAVSSDTAHQRRMWLNQILATDEALVSPQQWDSLEDRGAHLLEGDEIVLGFDGGDVNDATALIAIRTRDGLVQPILVEEKPADWPTGESAPRWFVDREKVELAVARAFADYSVQAMFCDVAYWESRISDWVQEWGHAVSVDSGGRNAFAFDMRGGGSHVTAANEWLLSAIDDRTLRVADQAGYVARRLRAHVLNAHRRENRYGVSFGKETRDSPRKIDGYAALVAAAAALRKFREGKKKDTKSGGGSRWWGF